MTLTEMTAKLDYLRELRAQAARGELDAELQTSREQFIKGLDPLIHQGQRILDDFVNTVSVKAGGHRQVLDLTLDLPETRITGQHSSYPNDLMRKTLSTTAPDSRCQRLLQRLRRWIHEH